VRVLLSAAGRAFLRSAAVAFVALIYGVWLAPDMNQALAIAGAASIAALDAGFRAIRVYVPGLSRALAERLGLSGAEVVITATQTFLAGLIAVTLDVLSAPDLGGARAAGFAGMLALGTALTRVVQAWLTPGETPVAGVGIPAPPQPVVPAALPTPQG
jgi:hypothetical protein